MQNIHIKNQWISYNYNAERIEPDPKENIYDFIYILFKID